MSEHLDVETRLSQIIGHILGTSNIDPEKTFFDLGGSSMDAMTLAHEINAEFGVDVPLQILFEASSLDEFSRGVIARVATQNAGDDDQDISTISI